MQKELQVFCIFVCATFFLGLVKSDKKRSSTRTSKRQKKLFWYINAAHYSLYVIIFQGFWCFLLSSSISIFQAVQKFILPYTVCIYFEKISTTQYKKRVLLIKLIWKSSKNKKHFFFSFCYLHNTSKIEIEKKWNFWNN